MPRTKMPVSFRLDVEIKEMAERRAKEERRNLTSYIEWLINEDCRKHPPAVRDKTV